MKQPINEDMTLEEAKKRYELLLTRDELKNLDEIDKDAFIAVEKKLTLMDGEDGVLTELVKQWFYFFRQNETYKKYCKAKKDKNQIEIDAFELNYQPAENRKGIAELYSDWGDIHARGLTFEKWLTKKSNLFFRPALKFLTILSPVKANDNDVVIVAIPKGLSYDEWQRLQRDYWKTHYAPQHEAYAPKYQFSTAVRRHTVLKLELAVFVDDMARYDEPTERDRRLRKISLTQTARTIMFNPLLRYSFDLAEDWRPDNKKSSPTFEELDAKGQLTLTEFESRKPYMQDLKRYYESCVNNTIYGVFPSTELLN